MSYKLVFQQQALKKWQKLDATIKTRFKKKLQERLIQLCVDSAKLSGLENCYKIKLRGAGYRLVYQVRIKNLLYRLLRSASEKVVRFMIQSKEDFN